MAKQFKHPQWLMADCDEEGIRNMSHFTEEKWRVNLGPTPEQLKELENSLFDQGESLEIMAEQAHKGSTKMEAFAENLERSKRTVSKTRAVGKTVALLGPDNVSFWLATAMAAKMHVKVTQDPDEESVELSAVRKETLTRADFPSRQAWRAHCRELAKQQSKEIYK